MTGAGLKRDSIATLLAASVTMGLMLTLSGCKPTPDPVELLKAMAEKLSTYKTTPAEIEKTHSSCGFSRVAYDVQKTESLVSPYAGVITGWFSCTGGKPVIDTEFKVTLVFQDEQWVLKDISYGTQFVDNTMHEWSEPMTSSFEGLIRQVLKSD